LDLGCIFETGGNGRGIGCRLVLSLDPKPHADFDAEAGKTDQDGEQYCDGDGHDPAPVLPKPGRYITC
jgi:hypothetical protein